MKDTLTQKIGVVLKQIDQGHYADALDKLENDVLQKTDGCPASNVPDKNDWITNCVAQRLIYPTLIESARLIGK